MFVYWMNKTVSFLYNVCKDKGKGGVLFCYLKSWFLRFFEWGFSVDFEFKVEL